MNYFITAIDTDSGKTLVSSILCEALGFDYWKPIQAGHPMDSDIVRSLVSNPKTVIWPEQYALQTPASPHAAAKIDNVTIDLKSIQLPNTKNSIIVEGAGGCLVPLNEHDFVIDIAVKLNTPVILVSDLYLGSINHTLLTAELLKKKNLVVKGIIFNGESNPESEKIILHHAKYKCLLRVEKEEEITREIVKKYATILKSNWDE
ncbi:MAG: dethiobiotin synthase [Flammeovirgaceae bacterium]|nr:dethiobiotin synthase [Flammeovirgaceae bacterium]